MRSPVPATAVMRPPQVRARVLSVQLLRGSGRGISRWWYASAGVVWCVSWRLTGVRAGGTQVAEAGQMTALPGRARGTCACVCVTSHCHAVGIDAMRCAILVRQRCARSRLSSADVWDAGHCKPCPVIVRVSMSCACGRARVPAPFPCGTALPDCAAPCERLRPCGHTARAWHTCHEGQCPPCTELVRRWEPAVIRGWRLLAHAYLFAECAPADTGNWIAFRAVRYNTILVRAPW